MEPPLQVVAGRDGILRDVHNRPMIVVFNSTKTDADASGTPGPRPTATARQITMPFAFVQVDGGKKEDHATRTTIRTHVMQDHFRRKRERARRTRSGHKGKPSEEPISASVVEADDLFGMYSIPPRPKASLDPFAKFPIDMKRGTYKLVEHYMAIIVPCGQPTEFGWFASFSQGMQEPALFHVICLSAAIHIGFMTGNSMSPDSVFHKLRAIQSVNEKLRDSKAEVSDQLIHAVTLMAVCEGVGADQGAANAHLDGLSRMVEARGGISALNHDLQQKICLAEYLCCIEPDKKPRFILPSSNQYPTFKKSRTCGVEVPVGFQKLMNIVTLDPEFVAILLDMVNFFVEFRQAYLYDVRKKLVASDYDVTSIRYRLLCMQSARRSGTHMELMGDACRIGALVFVKTIFDQFGCWGPNHKVYGRPYTILVEKLKVYLTRLDGSVDALKNEYLELSLWLTCMVGVMNLETGNRRWYNSHLELTAASLGLQNWDEVHDILRKFLWIQWVHEQPCKELWESVREGRDIQGEPGPLDRCIGAQIF